MVNTKGSFFDASELQGALLPSDKHLSEVLMRKVIAECNDPMDLLFEAAAGTAQENYIYSEHGETQRYSYESAATCIGARENNGALINGSWPSSRGPTLQNPSADANVLSVWKSSRCVKMGFLLQMKPCLWSMRICSRCQVRSIHQV